MGHRPETERLRRVGLGSSSSVNWPTTARLEDAECPPGVRRRSLRSERRRPNPRVLALTVDGSVPDNDHITQRLHVVAGGGPSAPGTESWSFGRPFTPPAGEHTFAVWARNDNLGSVQLSGD